MSARNGLRMDYNCFSGLGKTSVALANAVNSNSPLDRTCLPLVSGPVVVRMGKDLALQPGNAPGVVGNFSLQLNVTVNNQTNVDVNNPQLVVIACNSGFLITENGQSRVATGLVSASEAINAPNAGMDSKQLQRMVGGGFMSGLANALGKVASHPAAKAAAKEVLGCGARAGAGAQAGAGKKKKSNLHKLF